MVLGLLGVGQHSGWFQMHGTPIGPEETSVFSLNKNKPHRTAPLTPVPVLWNQVPALLWSPSLPPCLMLGGMALIAGEGGLWQGFFPCIGEMFINQFCSLLYFKAKLLFASLLLPLPAAVPML